MSEGTNAKGRTVYDALCDLTLQLGEWVNGQFQPFAEAFATGGHTSFNEADASKGAYTNAFKKSAAMIGCGKAAYEGTVDDDNVPQDETPHVQVQQESRRPEPQNAPLRKRSVSRHRRGRSSSRRSPRRERRSRTARATG